MRLPSTQFTSSFSHAFSPSVGRNEHGSNAFLRLIIIFMMIYFYYNLIPIVQLCPMELFIVFMTIHFYFHYNLIAHDIVRPPLPLSVTTKPSGELVALRASVAWRGWQAHHLTELVIS